MCNQVQSVTLQTAVLMQVKEFAQNNMPFSVHDITRTIRQKTAQGELEVPEVEVSGASFRFDIPHAKVKALFDELWRTGVFDPDFSLSRNFNGMYFEYTPSPVNGGAVTGGAAMVDSSKPWLGTIPPWIPASTATVAPQSTTPPDVADIAVEIRVQRYLTNCTTRNFRPTLKQIQSAIKRAGVSTGWSCEDLKAMVHKFGYTFVDATEVTSYAQVATV